MQQHADDFISADGLVAYIVTPDRSEEQQTGNPQYRDKVSDMAHTVATILKIPDEQVNIQTYLPVDKAEDESKALENTAAGHMIFDFDPEGGSDAKPNAWRIIWENSLIAGDQWS